MDPFSGGTKGPLGNKKTNSFSFGTSLLQELLKPIELDRLLSGAHRSWDGEDEEVLKRVFFSFKGRFNQTRHVFLSKKTPYETFCLFVFDSWISLKLFVIFVASVLSFVFMLMFVGFSLASLLKALFFFLIV